MFRNDKRLFKKMVVLTQTLKLSSKKVIKVYKIISWQMRARDIGQRLHKMDQKYLTT